jgi:hypothetical protein
MALFAPAPESEPRMSKIDYVQRLAELTTPDYACAMAHLRGHARAVELAFWGGDVRALRRLQRAAKGAGAV